MGHVATLGGRRAPFSIVPHNRLDGLVDRGADDADLRHDGHGGLLRRVAPKSDGEQRPQREEGQQERGGEAWMLHRQEQAPQAHGGRRGGGRRRPGLRHDHLANDGQAAKRRGEGRADARRQPVAELLQPALKLRAHRPRLAVGQERDVRRLEGEAEVEQHHLAVGRLEPLHGVENLGFDIPSGGAPSRRHPRC